MTAFSFDLLEQNIVLVRQSEEGLVAWQAPRGINIDKYENRWTINPEQAYVYKSLSAALEARRRLSDQPDFNEVYPIPLKQFREQNERLTFSTISELKHYNPKISTIFFLEYDGFVTFLSSNADVDKFLNQQKPSNYCVYKLKM